jgi:aspartate/methionine/tyrosine aminotransferase
MKLSWIVLSGPDELCEEAARRLEIIADFYLSASTPVQNALPRWLADKSLTENIRQRVRANRAFLESQRGLRVLKASGGWYAVLQAPPGRNDEVWALELLKNQRVLVHPGYLFDFEEEDWLVIGLLNPEEEFREGLGRMAVSWL